MSDRTEEIRKFLRQVKQDQQIEATQFERIVKRYYTAQGKDILSWGKKRHKEVFDLDPTEPLADFVVSNGLDSVIIAEAKGTDIDHALEQLRNLALRLSEKQPLWRFEFHLFLRTGADPANLTPAKNQIPRYKAKAAAEKMLWRTKYVLLDREGAPVTISLRGRERGSKVIVIIGPGSDKPVSG